MNKRGFEELLGRTIDNRYEIEKLLDTTRKSWVFLAKEVGEVSPGRNVAIKVLKPGQEPKRKEQFEQEAKTVGNLGSHQNIITVYGGGKDENYFYIAMEYVPGDNLQKRVDNNETFSLEKIVCLSHSLAEAVDFCHSHGIEHKDIKLKNLKEKENDGSVCAVLDFGSKFTRDKDSDDVYAMGSTLEQLLKYRENPKRKIPRKLGEIVDKAKNKGYSSPKDFKNAIENYRSEVRRGITRRKFLKVSGGIGLGSAASIYGISRYIKYSRTHHKLEDIIREIKTTENFNASLYRDLLHELYRVKIVPLIEAIPKDKFPLKVDVSGKYQTATNSYNDQGEWIRVVGLGYELTGDESYLKEAIERNEFLRITRNKNGNLTKMDELGINLTRITRANIFLIDLIEKSGLEEKYNSVRDELDAELREVVDIFVENKYRESALGGYFIMSPLDENLPNVTERSVIRSTAIDILGGMWRFMDKSLEDRLFSHIRLSNRYLFRDDGSVLDAALVHNENESIIERNIFGWLRGDFEPSESTKSCYNWTLMDFLMEMEYAYPYLNDKDKQITVKNLEKSLDFYIDNFNLLKEEGFFRERFILPIDFYEPMLKNKETWPDVKINNYPFVLSLKVLTDAIDIIEDEEFKNKAREVLEYTSKNLTRDISTSKDNQGIIWGASDTEQHLGEEATGYYMFADANYLEYLHYSL